MAQTIIQVDAFTDRPFAGNPAAVCVLPGPRDERWMQDVAREMNLSETAFLHREGDGFRLRWFTPTVEVDLCGHATLASAHVLWEEGHLRRSRRPGSTRGAASLTAQRRRRLDRARLPGQARGARPPAPFDDLRRGRRRAGPVRGGTEFDCLVEVDSEDAVRIAGPRHPPALRRSRCGG